MMQLASVVLHHFWFYCTVFVFLYMHQNWNILLVFILPKLIAVLYSGACAVPFLCANDKKDVNFKRTIFYNDNVSGDNMKRITQSDKPIENNLLTLQLLLLLLLLSLTGSFSLLLLFWFTLATLTASFEATAGGCILLKKLWKPTAQNVLSNKQQTNTVSDKLVNIVEHLRANEPFPSGIGWDVSSETKNN